MRTTCRGNHGPWSWGRTIIVAGAIALAASTTPAVAQTPGADELLSAVVQLKTYINPDGRTVEGLGQQRSGSGIVIDDNGLILTIGYLMVEAHSAEVAHQYRPQGPPPTSSATITTPASVCCARSEPLKVKPLTLGKSADLKEQDQVLAASFGGRAGIAPAYVMSRARIRRRLGIPDPERDLHRAGAFGMERRGAGVARRQARRRRLAGGRRRHRPGQEPARQHVRADRPAAADHGRPDLRRPGRRARAGRGSGSTSRSCAAASSSAA